MVAYAALTTRVPIVGINDCNKLDTWSGFELSACERHTPHVGTRACRRAPHTRGRGQRPAPPAHQLYDRNHVPHEMCAHVERRQNNGMRRKLCAHHTYNTIVAKSAITAVTRVCTPASTAISRRWGPEPASEARMQTRVQPGIRRPWSARTSRAQAGQREPMSASRACEWHTRRRLQLFSDSRPPG